MCSMQPNASLFNIVRCWQGGATVYAFVLGANGTAHGSIGQHVAKTATINSQFEKTKIVHDSRVSSQMRVCISLQWIGCLIPSIVLFHPKIRGQALHTMYDIYIDICYIRVVQICVSRPVQVCIYPGSTRRRRRIGCHFNTLPLRVEALLFGATPYFPSVDLCGLLFSPDDAVTSQGRHPMLMFCLFIVQSTCSIHKRNTTKYSPSALPCLTLPYLTLFCLFFAFLWCLQCACVLLCQGKMLGIAAAFENDTVSTSSSYYINF